MAVHCGQYRLTSREMLTAKHSTHLPVVKPSCSRADYQSSPNLPPKRQSQRLLTSLKPFFRHSVSVQLLRDGSSAEEQCFKFIRDYNGEEISTLDPKRLYRRYEQTVAYNRINLSRRMLPYINGCPRTGKETSPVKNDNSDFNKHSSQGLNTFVNFCTLEKYDYERENASHKQRTIAVDSSSKKSRNRHTNAVEFDFSSLGDLSELTIRDQPMLVSPTDARRVKVPCISRDQEAASDGGSFECFNDDSLASPECLRPQIIKIIPRVKEPAVRRHVTKKECKRRSMSHVAHAPPPSPARAPSSFGAYLKSKGVPLLEVNDRELLHVSELETQM